MILGTAGHVDHGKTALVRALTGVDTDRLAEEKRRGITIDIGFAPLRLASDLLLGVVDVPGHEAFVRNMLAGATGVDLALLVVAADEGVMPQTREHLAILSLLGIRGGVVALTKSDLAEPEWLELVREDLRAALAGSPLAGAPIVPTSVVTGDGLDALRGALERAARDIPARDAEDLFRLPIDRAFSVKGTGTVVTGTVWSGALGRDAVVRLLPQDRTARVRGIESHGAAVARALPGTRSAVALAGVDVADVPRGTMLVSDGAWTAARTLLAEVALLADAPRSLGARTAVRFHLGTSEVGARIVTAGGALEPGGRKQARVVLDAPVVARAGDRFVIRSASPVLTIGGGIVNDPAPAHRRARPWAAAAATPAERLARALDGAGAQGLAVASLPVRLGMAPHEVGRMLASANGHTLRVGDRLYASAAITTLTERFVALVDAHHARAPLDPGAPLQSVRAQVGAEGALVDVVLQALVREERLEVSGALVMRRGWKPVLAAAEREAVEGIRAELERAGREPPSVAELEAKFGPATVPLLRLMERDGVLVQVEMERFYHRAAVEEMLAALRGGMERGRAYGPSELRDSLGFSRKFLIPFLEYCDRIGVTERRADGRVLGSR
ncbi:MAG TPA: selenocysteine-specific translation elongation factor [Gemmatimonadaceae bacterium]|nr:selenocysteine-specific translation elongation factor [Gemmatimonadaceae bacterium]